MSVPSNLRRQWAIRKYIVEILSMAERFFAKFTHIYLNRVRPKKYNHIADQIASVLGSNLRDRGFGLTNHSIGNAIYSGLRKGHSPLSSTCKTLGSFGIRYEALKISDKASKDYEFIAGSFSYMENGEIFEVAEASIDNIIIFDSSGYKKSLTRDIFLKSWSNVVINLHTETPYMEYRFFERRLAEIWLNLRWPIFVFFIFVAACSLTQYKSLTLNAPDFLIWFILSTLSAIGLLLTSLMMRVYIVPGVQISPLMCNQSNLASCNYVMESRYAKIFGIPLTDIGFSFFAGLLFLWVLPGPISRFSLILSTISGIFVPIAIYVQSKLLKQFCRACLSVLGVLILISFSSGVHLLSRDLPLFANMSVLALMQVLFIFLIPALLWAIIRPAIKAYHHAAARLTAERIIEPFQLEAIRDEYSRLPQLSMKRVKGEILCHQGDENSEHLIVYLSTGCKHCKRVFHQVNQLILQKPKTLTITIRLIAYDPSSKLDEVNLQVTQYILALTNTYNSSSSLIALQSWYEDYEPLNIQSWLNQQEPLSIEKLHIGKLSNHELYQSYKDLNLTGTPTLFWNGKKLPQSGSIAEFLLLNTIYLGEDYHNTLKSRRCYEADG